MKTYTLHLDNNETVYGLSRFEVLQLSDLEGYKNAKIEDEGNIVPLQEWTFAYYDRMFQNDHFVFKGEKLTKVEALLVFRWLYPKSWQLLYFEYERGIFKLGFEGQGEICFSKDDYSAKIDIDKSKRRLITIELKNGIKYRFFESLVNYADEEFELMIRLLEAKESGLMIFSEKLMKFNDSIRKIHMNLS